jgi:hypothetical protein
MQSGFFIGIGIETGKGENLECIYMLLWILVIEFVMKDKKNITIIKTDAVYLEEKETENKLKGDDNSGRN